VLSFFGSMKVRPMDLDHCFQILEIDRHASIEEVKQAYKDIVNVWHPDRFSENPRLRGKAERKLKEINAAYEKVQVFWGSRPESRRAEKVKMGSERASTQGSVHGGSGAASGNRSEPSDLTEAAFEVGTRLVLTFWSYLSKRFHEVIDAQEASPESERQPESK
jgi:DnaJ-class molecular chaperone